MMVAFLKHLGTTDCWRERLKMSVSTSASWSIQVLSAWLRTPSGPIAFLGLTLLSTVLTSEAVREGAGVSRVVRAGGIASLVFRSKGAWKASRASGSNASSSTILHCSVSPLLQCECMSTYDTNK